MKRNYTTVLAAVVTLAASASAVQAVTLDLNTNDNSGWMVQRYETDFNDKASFNPVLPLMTTLNSTSFNPVAVQAITPSQAGASGAWIEPTSPNWTAKGSSALSWVTTPNPDQYNQSEVNGTSYIYMKTFTLGQGSYTLDGQFASDDWLASMTLVKFVNGQWEEVYDFGLDTYSSTGDYYRDPTSLSYTFDADLNATEYALVANVINSYPISSDDYNNGKPPMPTGFIFGGTVTSNAVPEPASLSLLGLGAAALIARRRK